MISNFSGEYAFLSNFFPSPILVPATLAYPDTEWPYFRFATVEHAYQSLKCANEADLLAIKDLDTPGQAKRAGREVALRPYWDDVKVGLMYKLLVIKFSKHPFTVHLSETSPMPLVEGNTWHDNFWGKCSCPKCSIGHNWLGYLLMLARSELWIDIR